MHIQKQTIILQWTSTEMSVEYNYKSFLRSIKENKNKHSLTYVVAHFIALKTKICTTDTIFKTLKHFSTNLKPSCYLLGR